MSDMTGYTFRRGALERIARERGTINAESIDEISTRQKNLMLADMLFVVLTSPDSTSSITKQHGDYSTTIGSMKITEKDDIRELMNALYNNPDSELNQILTSYQGGVRWVQEYD
jgi:hypothetical protein